MMVTPRIVQPLDPNNVPAGPEYPKPFLDQEKFDGPRGESRRSGAPSLRHISSSEGTMRQNKEKPELIIELVDVQPAGFGISYSCRASFVIYKYRSH